jgi:hypothetical protein
MNCLLYCFPRSDEEMEREILLDRAFIEMRRDPRMTEINFSPTIFKSRSEREQLWRLSDRHGLDVEIDELGGVTVRRPVPKVDIPSAPSLTKRAARGLHGAWHALERGCSSTNAHVRHWHSEFEGLSEGIR